MAEQKNPLFVIEIFYEIHKLNNNTVLWMIGDGELKVKIENKVKELGLDTCVELLGYRDDVNDLMMGMDALIFPSFHEGLSIVLIEAQATGLPVFASDSISQEHKISNRLKFISLSSSAEIWADIILKSDDIYKNDNRNQAKIDSCYNINNVAEEVKRYYVEMLS
ncbi:MAG: glycosyltransferase [Lachnospiraceae bacterium]|nr:glycosyltransferase [Lachnospiraceae bacterium]